MTGPNLRATGVPFDVRRAHPYSVYPGARLRHPDADRGRLPGALPAPHRRDQAEPPDHRPVPPPDARRAGHGQAAAPAPAAPGPGLRGGRGPARPVRDLRHQRRHRPAVPDAHPRPVVHPPAGGRRDDAGPPHRRHHGRSWPASTRSWAASTSDAVVAEVAGDRPDPARARSSSPAIPRAARADASALVVGDRRCSAGRSLDILARQPADRPVRRRRDGRSC